MDVRKKEKVIFYNALNYFFTSAMCISTSNAISFVRIEADLCA